LIELRVNSGLCNRMRAMACALALSRAAKQPLRVYWFNTAALNCPYRKLFEPIEGAEVIVVETRRLRAPFSVGAMRLKAAERRRPYDLFLSGDKIEEYRDQGVDLALPVARAKRCGIDTYARFYGAPPFYDEFKAKQNLAREAEKTLAAIVAGGGTGRVVGVHIRRGDNDASIQVSPLDLFLKRMQREMEQDPDARFFLATDDPGTELAVTDAFPGRVTTRGKDFARNRTAGVQDALVDLQVLSKCSLVLGSYWSSFSQTAAEMGGVELEIVRT
jgi:hypothetical protein